MCRTGAAFLCLCSCWAGDAVGIMRAECGFWFRSSVGLGFYGVDAERKIDSWWYLPATRGFRAMQEGNHVFPCYVANRHQGKTAYALCQTRIHHVSRYDGHDLAKQAA